MHTGPHSRIILADRHGGARTAMRDLLDGEPDLKVIAVVERENELVRLVSELMPDVLVMDICVVERPGLELIERLRNAAPGVNILVSSQRRDSRYVTRALHAGASGYLLKDRSYEELAGAVRTIVGNGTYVSPGIAGVVYRA